MHTNDSEDSAADYWIDEAERLYQQHDYPEALEAVEQALAQDPQLSAGWVKKGTILRELRRYAEGLDALDRVLALDPENAAIWHERGWMLYCANAFAGAVSAYESSLSLVPFEHDPRCRYGGCSRSYRRGGGCGDRRSN